jgi:hypothetical protein
MSLVPLKIKITRHAPQGQLVNKYPDFNSLPAELRAGLDWSQFFDHYGLGWHYDKCGFGEVDAENPDPTCQYGYTLVPEDFAAAALAAFPETVSEIDEAEFERVYNERCHDHEPEFRYDLSVLQALAAKRQLGIALTVSEQESLDPDHPRSGIVRNPRKTWENYKKLRAPEIVKRLEKARPQ